MSYHFQNKNINICIWDNKLIFSFRTENESYLLPLFDKLYRFMITYLQLYVTHKAKFHWMVVFLILSRLILEGQEG